MTRSIFKPIQQINHQISSASEGIPNLLVALIMGLFSYVMTKSETGVWRNLASLLFGIYVFYAIVVLVMMLFVGLYEMSPF